MKQKILETLRKELEVTRPTDFFGGDTHAQIKAGIDYLKGEDKEEVYQRYAYDEQTEIDIWDFLEQIDDCIKGEVPLEDIVWNQDSIPTDSNISVCQKLCNACPFSKKSMSGFLADYSIEDFISYQRHDIMFPCHKMVGDEMSVNDAQEAIRSGKMKICRGYAESMRKSCKTPRNDDFSKLIKDLELSEDSMSIFEFKKHHTV